MQKIRIRIEDRFVDPLLKNKGFLLDVDDTEQLIDRFRIVAKVARIRSLRLKAYVNKIKQAQSLPHAHLFIAKMLIEAQSKKFKILANI